MDVIKGEFISVAVTHEGEQLRVIPGVPGLPVKPTQQLLWVNGACCHYSAWKLTDTGDQPPRIDVQGANIDNTTLFGLDPVNSFTNNLVIGASGKQYTFDATFPVTTSTQVNQIAVFAPGANGNVAPLGAISGSNTHINNTTTSFYYVAVDLTENIYVLDFNGSSTSLYTWPAGTFGNVAPTVLFNRLNYTAGDFEYDALNNQFWVVDSANSALRAYSLTGVAGQVISGASTGFTNQLQAVNAGTDGRIYTLDFNAGHPKISIFPNGSNGNVAPTTTISGASTQMQSPDKIAADASGNIYVDDHTAFSILVYAAGSSGNVAPSQVISGDYTGLRSMIVGAATHPAGVEIGIGTLPSAPAYSPPATHFNAAKVSSNTFTASSSRYGLLSVWSFNYTAGDATILTTVAGNVGLTFSAIGGDNPGGEDINLTLYDGTNSQIMTTFAGFAIPGWRHDIMSWDTVTQKIQWFVNGASTSNYLPANTIWNSSNPVSYSGGTWIVGDGIKSFDVSELWFATPASFFDLTVTANLNKFVIGDGVVAQAVNLGATGTNPGITPLLYMTGSGGAFATNQGTGGGFALASGALSAAATQPGSSP